MDETFLTVLLYALFSIIPTEARAVYEDSKPTKYELLHYLLNETRYDASIPPNYISGNTTDVAVQIKIYDLSSESEHSMEFECTMFVKMEWKDLRLDFSKNGTFDVLKVSGSYIGRVWIPDIFFIHDRNAEFLGFIGKNELIYIRRNGSILFSGRITMKSRCLMDLTFYPYDTHICQIAIQSYAYTADDVMLHWTEPNPIQIDSENLKDFPEWRNSTCESDTIGNYSILHAGIKLIRPTSSNDILYIAPPIVLVFIAMTSFSFGENITPRLTVCGAAMTTLIMHWAGIYNKLQPASALRMIDTWMLANLCCIGLIILANSFSHHLFVSRQNVMGAVESQFKHLMKETIYKQLRRSTSERDVPAWNDVKKWLADDRGKRTSQYGAIDSDSSFAWTIDPRFYAVPDDKLRQKYYREFVKDVAYNKGGNRFGSYLRTSVDITSFIVFALCYTIFTSIFICQNWRKGDGIE